MMRVGIPTEIKQDENRVAITPSGVAAFQAHGRDVVVQAGAGQKSGIPDAALAGGVNLVDGRVTHAAVAAAHGLEHTPLETL